MKHERAILRLCLARDENRANARWILKRDGKKGKAAAREFEGLAGQYERAIEVLRKDGEDEALCEPG